jgi:hypothetical protein
MLLFYRYSETTILCPSHEILVWFCWPGLGSTNYRIQSEYANPYTTNSILMDQTNSNHYVNKNKNYCTEIIVSTEGQQHQN